jgi:hypothetical protein
VLTPEAADIVFVPFYVGLAFRQATAEADRRQKRQRRAGEAVNEVRMDRLACQIDCGSD